MAILSGCRHGAAVDDAFGAGNGGRAGRDEECDVVGDLLRLRWPPERYAPEALHDDLLAALVVGASIRGEPLRKGDRRFGLDPARRDTHRTHAFWRDLF